MIIHLDGPDCYTGQREIWWITPNMRIRCVFDFLCWEIPFKWFDKLGKELRVGDRLNGARIVKIDPHFGAC